MKTSLSSKGQIVLPAAVRRKLGLQPGAEFEVTADDDRVVLIPKRSSPAKFRQGTDGVSGLPVLEISGSKEMLTSAQVAELLADLP